MTLLFTDELLDWLRTEQRYPKVYWKDRDSTQARAAVGAEVTWNAPPVLDPQDTRAAYGGMCFNRSLQQLSVWKDLPESLFWLPEEERCAYPACYTPSSIGKAIQQTHSPSLATWTHNVRDALEMIHQGQLSKIVLARQTQWICDPPPSVWDFMTSLEPTQKTLFAFEFQPGLAFFGATPELLFQRQGKRLSVDALAGTLGPGQNRLLESLKERREFEIVKHALEALLTPHSSSLKWGQDTARAIGHLEHLYNRLDAVLHSTLSDTDLIQMLHPTPALGGYPKETALRMIDAIEPFHRGWYGAPIGCVRAHVSHFYVGIRSALLHNSALYTFAAAGIVEGSKPEDEWEEITRKMQPIAQCLQL